MGWFSKPKPTFEKAQDGSHLIMRKPKEKPVVLHKPGTQGYKGKKKRSK
jgi:hypothetical protein